MNSKKPYLAYISGNPIFTVDSPSGYSTRIRELCRGFESLGIKTSVHVPGLLQTLVQNAKKKSRKSMKSMIPACIWETLKDAYRWRLDRAFAKRLLSEFEEGKPDVIYECLEYSGSVTERLRRKLNALFVLEIHGPLQEDAKLTSGQRPLQWIYNRKIKRAVHQADFVVVVSGVIKRWLLEEYPNLKEEKIIVLPNGVHLEAFTPCPVSKATKNLVVGFVGSDLFWHRLDALIEAFALLPKDLNLQLHIVGLANGNESLRQLVQKNQLEDRIHFLGPLPFDQVPKAMAAFDIAVMPGSNRYGSPIKLFEYGAMAKAVIAPNEPPVREVFQDNQDLLLVPSGDILALKNAILSFVSDVELRSRLSNNLMNKVRTQYGWNHIARNIATRIHLL